MKNTLRLFGLAAVSLALFGAGCRRLTSTPSEPVLPTVSSSSTISVPSSEDPSTSLFLSLEGGLETERANIEVMLNLGPERVTGRYELAGSHGSVYGTVSSTLSQPIQLSFARGDEEILTFSGSYNSTTGQLIGTAREPGDQKDVQLVLSPKLETEGVRLQLKKIEQKAEIARGVSCHTAVEYPIILPSEYIPAERAARINQQIRAFLGESSTSTLELLVDVSQQECVDMQRENVAASSDEDPSSSGTNDYEYETSVNVTRNERGLLSLVYVSYSYTGGAHPNSVSYSHTFDLSTGKQLKLTDLIRSDVLPDWIQVEQAALLRSEYGEWLFDQEVSEAIADGSLKGEAASSSAAYQSIDQWYLTKNALVRYYQPYEIAAYAAGIPSVEMPYVSWRPYSVPGVDRWFK